jgi:MoaA/NifB/PqqE/SkfB family radical SAM enzyme
MALSTFDHILAGLSGQKARVSFFFGGFGEPLMNPNIVEMVEKAGRVGSKVELITNGILLDADLAARLINSGLNTLWVSLDGASPESYSDVRRSNSLGGVLQNIATFRDQYRMLRRDEPDIGVVFVAMKRNFDELPTLIRQSIRLGISRYMVTNILPYTPEMCEEVLYRHSVDRMNGNPAPWNPSIHLPEIDINPITRETLLKMRTVRPGGLTYQRDYCPFIEQRSTSVSWDGTVSPCLALLHSHTSYLFDIRRSVNHYQLGNVNDRPLMEIWLSDEYTRFRQKVEQFEFAPCTICASCEMAEANQEDCFGNTFPTCGGCLWAKGVIQCP